mmetsp:Transcript_5016/g.12924  ORF Transcript_5016/g.12924 Transcript_5016/m.12924 type:complete len:477 (-) Transcript_5016:272-1702(-)|eukprot:CAMPEP_0119430294 /NCGR_PEP_ID=MMETSP1335-20130426/43778_1 /TAXON_ID=259385 /ORGANISM="Chrysoculter rhomboideus, Strain RCC1486" /LENGTH=476 /DNA_ID=CAMNT_0007456049 /DNA_START=138 /DNA_END=1568 /DNA_ORIENTATION=+
MAANGSPQWRFRQIFGERDPSEETAEEDLISAVEFNENGTYLATGDRGGRIVIFESSEMDNVPKGNGQGTRNRPQYDAVGSESRRSAAARVEYRFYCEFQSHEPEFDYLKSLEIEERINRIRWCRGYAGSRCLLSTNDKTIKLWKIYEKKVKLVTAINTEARMGAGGASVVAPPRGMAAGGGAPLSVASLRMPMITPHDVIVTAMPKRVYANGHAYHINSIGTNCDGETFLSADDLRINLWHLGSTDVCFNIVDIKPADMEDLSEVLTAAEFHPSACALFAYSSSKGSIRMGDMRQRALCDTHAKLFDEGAAVRSSFFSEVVSSVSDIKFSADGRYILARDYMTLKLWDVAMERAPVLTLDVHDHLRAKLCELYENDLIFDRFECGWSGDGKLVTGSYNRRVHIFDADGSQRVTVEADKGATPTVTQLRSPRRAKANAPPEGPTEGHSKILFHSHHPQLDLLAIAASNSLYIFAAS